MARHHGRISLAAIFDSYSEGLVRAFQETERGLGLPIDRGEGREKALRKFLEDNLPKRYGVGTGFVINSKGQQSKQADIIIYDAGICPMFSLQGTCAYPIEAVYGMIEVKSTLDKKSFGEAWENAHRFKQVAWGDILTERKNSPKQFIHARSPRYAGLFAYRARDWQSHAGDKWYLNVMDVLRNTVPGSGFDSACVNDEGVILPIRLSSSKDTPTAIVFSDPGADWRLIRSDDFNPLTLFYVNMVQVLNTIELARLDMSLYFHAIAKEKAAIRRGKSLGH